MDSILIRLGSWLVDVYLASTVLLAITVGLNHFIRQPVRRVLAARMALVFVALLAAAAAALPTSSRVSLHWFPVPQPGATATVASPRSNEARDDNGALHVQSSPNDSLAAPHPQPGATLAAPGSLPFAIPQTVAIVFLTVASIIGLWLSIGRLLVQRLIWSSEPAAPGVQRLWRTFTKTNKGGAPRWVRLLTNNRLAQPVATGLAAPAILLPRTLEHDEENCRAALAHEWEHIRRGDLWVLTLCRWMSLVLFAQPLYWVLIRRMRFDQELVADRAAARQMDPLLYAEWLIHWSRRARTHRFPVGPLLTMAAQRGLKARVAALLTSTETWEEVAPSRWRQGMSCGLAVVAIGLSLITSRGVASRGNDRPAPHSSRLAISAPKGVPSIQLANTSAVEVVAMRSHPCDGDFWWDLEGNLLVESGPRRESPQHPPEVIVRVLPLDKRQARWAPDSPLARPLDSIELEQLSALGVDEGTFFAVRLATGASGVELPLTTTQWTTRSLSTCAESSGNDEFKYDPCTDAGDLVVSVTHSTSVREQLKLMAMDRDGTEHAPTKLSMSDGELTAVFDDLELQDAQCFFVQSRPQVNVSLRQLPVTPGQANALVEIEQRCAEGNAEGQL